MLEKVRGQFLGIGSLLLLHDMMVKLELSTVHKLDPPGKSLSRDCLH